MVELILSQRLSRDLRHSLAFLMLDPSSIYEFRVLLTRLAASTSVEEARQLTTLPFQTSLLPLSFPFFSTYLLIICPSILQSKTLFVSTLCSFDHQRGLVILDHVSSHRCSGPSSSLPNIHCYFNQKTRILLVWSMDFAYNLTAKNIVR